MHILDDEDPRAIHTQRFDQIAELTQHPFSCRPEYLIPERGAVRHIEKTGHLEQPGRRMGAHGLQDSRTVRAATTRRQRIDQREKCLVGAETLGAESAQGLDAISGKLLHRHLDERGLADTSLAGDEDDLSVAGEHSLRDLVQRRQRTVSPDEPAGPAGD